MAEYLNFAEENEWKRLSSVIFETKIMGELLESTVTQGSVNLFAEQMKKLVNNQDFSDIKFVVGSQRQLIYSHKCLLSARCKVFRAMFEEHTDIREDVPFVLSDIHPEIFLALLEYIYTNCCTLNQKLAVDVMAIAIEYGLDDLRMMCVHYISGNQNVSDACQALQASVSFSQDELQKNSLSYIEDNTAEVFRSSTFQELTEDGLSVILRSDKLNIDEMEVIQHVKQWAKACAVVSGKTIAEVAKKVVTHIRLPLLSMNELSSVENENRSEYFIPIDMIAFAWKYHADHKVKRGNKWTTKRKGTLYREGQGYLQEPQC